MRRASNKTSVKEIVDYWASRIDECDISVDWSEAEEYCWCCGSPKELVRCHIVPHSLGGADGPWNYVLLCRTCHAEAPNVADPRIMWDWLAAHKSTFYRTFWVVEGEREYHFMYGRSVIEELSFIYEGTECEQADDEIAQRIMEDAVRQTVRHFGQSAPNRATGAGMLRIYLMKLAQLYGKKLPDARPSRLTDRQYFT